MSFKAPTYIKESELFYGPLFCLFKKVQEALNYNMYSFQMSEKISD
jgi:hypothetical protein